MTLRSWFPAFIRQAIPWSVTPELRDWAHGQLGEMLILLEGPK
jgi:hypothetical protein